MKKLLPIFVIITIVAITIITFLSLAQKKQMVVVKENNLDKLPLQIQTGHFQDSDCGMVIENMKYASQVISKSGKTWFFHDHGGMAHWLYNSNIKNNAVLWVMSVDTNEWINGREAWYSRTDNTPMNTGFGAYKSYKDGYITFAEMSKKMLRGENLTNPYIKSQLLGSN